MLDPPHRDPEEWIDPTRPDRLAIHADGDPDAILEAVEAAIPQGWSADMLGDVIYVER